LDALLRGAAFAASLAVANRVWYQSGDRMKMESVAIFCSDALNAQVVRHPGRRFPGNLVQGDTLHAMVASLRCVMENGAGLDEEPAGRLREVAERMEELLAHYRSALTANRIQLPFRD
jgi:hypothetical protein